MGPLETVTVVVWQPGRAMLLAAMQQRGIELPNHDVVVARGQSHAVD